MPRGLVPVGSELLAEPHGATGSSAAQVLFLVLLTSICPPTGPHLPGLAVARWLRCEAVLHRLGHSPCRLLPVNRPADVLENGPARPADRQFRQLGRCDPALGSGISRRARSGRPPSWDGPFEDVKSDAAMRERSRHLASRDRR